MQQGNYPKLVVSFLPGGGGNFIGSIFAYLLESIPLILSTKVGNAHRQSGGNYFPGPLLSMDEEYFSKFVIPMLPQFLSMDKEYFSKFVNPMYVLNRLGPNSQLAEVLLGYQECTLNTRLVGLTHIIRREFLENWYNYGTSRNTEIISIVCRTEEEMLKSFDLFLHKIERIPPTTGMTPIPLASFPTIAQENKDRLLPMSAIFDKDSDYIFQFISKVCDDINVGISNEQAETVKAFIDDYFRCQPIL